MKRLAIIFLSATLLSSPALAEDNKVVATYIDGNVTAAQVMEQFKSVLEMQPENKKHMDYISFLNGHRIKIGETL